MGFLNEVVQLLGVNAERGVIRIGEDQAPHVGEEGMAHGPRGVSDSGKILSILRWKWLRISLFYLPSLGEIDKVLDRLGGRAPLLGGNACQNLGEEDGEEHPSRFSDEEAHSGLAFWGDIKAQSGAATDEDGEEATLQNVEGAAAVGLRDPSKSEIAGGV